MEPGKIVFSIKAFAQINNSTILFYIELDLFVYFLCENMSHLGIGYIP